MVLIKHLYKFKKNFCVDKWLFLWLDRINYLASQYIVIIPPSNRDIIKAKFKITGDQLYYVLNKW